MTVNRLLTIIVQSALASTAITMWVMLALEALDDRRAARYERTQIKWVFPPHSETQRLAAAHRLFVDGVHSELDGVQ